MDIKESSPWDASAGERQSTLAGKLQILNP